MYGAPIPVREFTNAADVVEAARLSRALMFPPSGSSVRVDRLARIRAHASAVKEPEEAQEPVKRDILRIASNPGRRVVYSPITGMPLFFAPIETGPDPLERVRERTGYMSARGIIAQVSKLSGVPICDIESDRRQHNIVVVRHFAMWFMKKHTLMSLPEVGRAFGGRDHTTVIHACRKVGEVMADLPFGDSDASWRETVEVEWAFYVRARK